MSSDNIIQTRLLELKNSLNLKQADIVEKTGIDKVTISLYFSGSRIPKNANIKLIADAYNLDPAWLMGYDVPMFRTEIVSDSEFVDLLELINEDASFFKSAIESLSKIPNDQRDTVITILNALAK